LFGEGATKQSYAVLCLPEDQSHISSVFQDAAKDNTSPAEFRLLDCNFILPNAQKSIADRFKLNLKQRPTIFVSGHTGPPKQIPSKHLKTGNMLVKALKHMLEPRAAKIETTLDLRTKCLNQDVCGLLLKGSKTVSGQVKTAVTNLLEQHPKVAFASVDTSVLFVRNLEEHLPEFSAGTHRFVVFQKVSGGLDAKEDRLVTSIAPLTDLKIGYTTMNELVQSVVDGKTTMTKIPSLPIISTRTKKLEEEERAKRQRQQERNSFASSGDDETSSGRSSSTFSANDGSAQGRKLEREKRRAEHNQQHNIKPKTPDEIQEMERTRRIRMEQEAERWNMAPDDAPEEGERLTNEADYMDMENDNVEEKQDENDEDDVMDLD
jgi:hypothetical protein